LFIALVDKVTHPRNKKGVISSLVLRRCCRPTIRIFPSFRLPKKNPPPTNRYGHNKQKRAETASSANANKVGDDWRWWWWSSLLIIFHQQLSKPSSWRKRTMGRQWRQKVEVYCDDTFHNGQFISFYLGIYSRNNFILG
jgi:hypothetical protein